MDIYTFYFYYFYHCFISLAVYNIDCSKFELNRLLFNFLNLFIKLNFIFIVMLKPNVLDDKEMEYCKMIL